MLVIRRKEGQGILLKTAGRQTLIVRLEVLPRGSDQSIKIGTDDEYWDLFLEDYAEVQAGDISVKIHYLRYSGATVQLGIEAPHCVSVFREEAYRDAS